MNKEEYEELLDSGDPAGELIESLRAVARAAKERQLWYHAPEDIEAALNEALDAVPAWVLESEEA